jgi:hypothetical protein
MQHQDYVDVGLATDGLSLQMKLVSFAFHFGFDRVAAGAVSSPKRNTRFDELRLRYACGHVLIAVLLFSMMLGCSIRPQVVNHLANGPWRGLESVNSIRVFSSDRFVLLESLGYVRGPFDENQSWGRTASLPQTFLVPLALTVAVGQPLLLDHVDALPCQNLPDELAAAFQRVQRYAVQWFDDVNLPSVELRLALPRIGVRYWETSTGERFSDTTVKLVVPPPDKHACNGNLQFWIADIVETVVHELQHIRAHQATGIGTHPLADELNASILGHCARFLSLGWLPHSLLTGVRFGDEPIEFVHNQFDRGLVDASMGGKLMAEAIRRTVLGQGDVTGERGVRFLALCEARAMDFRVPRSVQEAMALMPTD